MRTITLLLALMLPFAAHSQSGVLPADTLARGKLLYTTHCISCHSVEIHWRAKKLVSDWSALKAQVSRWQKSAGLGWSEDDVEQVGAYLNATYYHFPAAEKIGLDLQEITK